MPRISARRLDFLFRPPTIEPASGPNSTVHLLRRECQDTLANIRTTVVEAEFPGRRRLHRLFASTIVMCTQFDLLGKLRYGDAHGVRRTFIRVLVKQGGLSSVEARRVWDARNALVHSFGLRVVLPARRRRSRRVSSVRIQLSANSRAVKPVVRLSGRRWQLEVRALYRLMVSTTFAVEWNLRRLTSQADVESFNRMFVHYGRITIAK
jgi:hypothetical protein